MLVEGFDPTLMNVHADAYARDLMATMRASRRSRTGTVIRRWVGERLVRAGESLAAEPGPRLWNATTGSRTGR